MKELALFLPSYKHVTNTNSLFLRVSITLYVVMGITEISGFKNMNCCQFECKR